jgi:uncharacterized membrane protein
MFLLLVGHRPRAGLVIFAISVTYFIVLRFVIMPAAGSWGFADLYRQLLPPGENSFGGVVKTLVSNPLFTFTTLLTSVKLKYALQVLIPIAFLPLRRPYLVLALVPGSILTLLTTDYAPTVDIGYQYSANWAAYPFVAAALALEALGHGPGGVVRRRAAVATLLAATLLATAHWGAIPPRQAFHAAYGTVNFGPVTEQHRQWRRGIEDMLEVVPKDAVLAVSDRELPHVSNRVDCWNMSSGIEGADYVLYTTHHPIPSERVQTKAALAAGFQKVMERPGLVLLRRPGLN